MNRLHVGDAQQQARVDELAGQVAYLEGVLASERSRADHLLLITEVARQIGGTLNQDDLLQQIATTISQRLGYDRANVVLLEANQVVWRGAAGWTHPAEVVGMRLPLGQGIVGWVAEHGRSLLVNDVTREPRYLPEPTADRGRAELAVPIRHRGHTIGVLDVQSLEPNVFQPDDVATLEILAEQIAVALENARVYRAMERHLAEVVALQEVGTAIMGEGDIRRVLETVAEQARRLLGAETVSLELLEAGRPWLEVAVCSGLHSAQLVGLRLPLDDSLSGEVLRTGRVLYTRDAPNHPLTHKETVARADCHSLLVAPMGCCGREVGTLSAYNKTDRPFSERDAELMALFGGQAAVAIENARLLERERRRARQSEALARTSIAINSSLDLTRTLEAIAVEVCEALEAKRSAVLQYDSEDDTVSAGADYGLQGAKRAALYALRLTREQYKSFRVTWTGQTLVIDDAAQDQEINAEVRSHMGMRSFMATPLRVQGRYLGFLYVDQGDALRRWTDDDRRLFESLAGPVATAVENARLHGQAQRLAVMEERTRLARELHDSVTQSLFSASMLAQAAQALWKRDAEKAKERLDRAAELCGGALAEMRALIFELRPAALEEEGLVSALRKHAAARQTRDGIAVELATDNDRRMSPSCEEAAYRIVREALHNVVKHARASLVRIDLKFAEDRLLLDVHDDGQGFDPSERAGTGLGLTSMRERAELLGGNLVLTSGPGRGTTIHAEIPEQRE